MSYMDRVLTIPIPTALDEQVRAAASAGGLGLSEFTRQALAAAVERAGFRPPPVARRPSDRRIDAILRLPEAKGRRELAERLAFRTNASPEEAQAILRVAAPDPAGGGSK